MVGIKHYADDDSLIQDAEGTWLRWKLMFQLASLLHDSGHSPFSHTLEFVYDLEENPQTLSDRLVSRCSEQFKNDFKVQSERNDGKPVGKPHERMSALFVVKEEQAEKLEAELHGGFKTRIRNLIESYMHAYGIFNVYKKNSKIFDDDIEFMVRMIIGCPYELDQADHYVAKSFHIEISGDVAQDWRIELQIRNCIISMLNSKLDVDNLDYVVRDSKYSGYASNSIDLERLLSSFTIINAYEFHSPVHLSRESYFDASVNLDSFEGTFINAKISGECMISSKHDNLNLQGNIITDTEDLSPKAKKKIFRTKEEFSATVSLEEEHNSICIRPKTAGQKAYLNISGNLEGNFTGIVLGDTCQEVKNDPQVEHRIFFAYKQNCMSVLMSAIDGSNFENKWVYAHHTTTFKNNYLTVYLLERYAEYLVDCEVEAFLGSMEDFLEKNEPSSSVNFLSDYADRKDIYQKIDDILQTYFPGTDGGYDALRSCLEENHLGEDADFLYGFLDLYQILNRIKSRRAIDKKRIDNIIDKIRGIFIGYHKGKFFDPALFCSFQEIYNNYRTLGALEIQCFAQIMTMFKPKNIQGHYFYRADDQDLMAEYKKLYHQLSDKPEKIDNYKEFMITYRHMITRTSMLCLWKLYPEFNFYFSDWTEEEMGKLVHLLRRTSTPWGKAAGEKQLNYAILSDYVQLSDNAHKLWETLKEDYKLTRLVYVEQAIRTKSFKRHETYIKNHERVVRLEDIRLYPNHQNNVEFFYIFYEADDSSKKKEFTPNNFLYEIRKLFDKNGEESSKTEEIEVKRMDENGNVIIRDNIHGDIVFPPLFKAIIDTKEFQRLRRIKQLAMAEQVFPGAVHTRFSHSIGTYHVMHKVLTHFKEYFSNLNYHTCIDDLEESAILAAALLHDLGHGPYSHVFERTKLSLGCQDHEKWTTSIIKDTGTELYSVLECVQKGFAEKVAGYIECEKEIKKGEVGNQYYQDENLNLKFIFASLVSGQIDADRMDYLLRDAKFSGVTYGQFDVEKVIEGLAVSVDHAGCYRVCIREEYLPAVEGYFYARYQMYNNIYYHPYKLFSEELFCRILREAQKSVLNGQISNNMIPAAVESIFTQAEISNEEYFRLDDSVIDGAIQTWAESGVAELAFLCKARLDRKYYEQIEVMDYPYFEEMTKSIFGEDVFDKHFLICDTREFRMYESQKPVYILKKNGVIEDLEKCSNLVKERMEKRCIFYSRDMAKRIYGITEECLREFDQKLEKNCMGSNMEIEKKYTFPEDKIDVVSEYLQDMGKDKSYKIEYGEEKLQVDTYFDTQDLELGENDYTLRIREKGDKIYLTCKRPIQSESNGIGGQLERIENEELIQSTNLEDHRELVKKFLNGISNLSNIADELQPKIKIENKRKKVLLQRESGFNKSILEKYEVVIDNVSYGNLENKKNAKECQLEIELKSSYQNRINMKLLTDEMEQKLKFLSAISDSKYQRALRFTRENT